MAVYTNQAITQKQNVLARSTNRFSIVFGDVVIGMLQDLRCSDDYAPEPLSGIGDIHIKEYVPTVARHSISTTQATLYKGALRVIGVALENGDDALKGMTFDIEVHDRTAEGSVTPGSLSPITFMPEGEPGTVLRRYEKCSFASGDVEIRKNAICINSAQINACAAVTPQGSARSLI